MSHSRVRIDAADGEVGVHLRTLELGAEGNGQQLLGDAQDDEHPPSSVDHPSTDSEVEVPWRSIGLKVLVSISLFLVTSCLLEKYAEKHVTQLSRELMHKIGLPGLFWAVVVADGVPQPFTYVPLIFIAVKGAVPKAHVFFVCAAASYCAALLGYGLGFLLRSTRWGAMFFNRLNAKYPYVPEIMQRRGAAGVALAALLPMPLAVATWTAGSFCVDFRCFMAAGLCRCPKIAVFVMLSQEAAARGAAGTAFA